MSEKDFNFVAITRFQMYQAGTRNRSSHRTSSLKKVFMIFSQNSQENTCARASDLQLYQKRDSGADVFL